MVYLNMDDIISLQSLVIQEKWNPTFVHLRVSRSSFMLISFIDLEKGGSLHIVGGIIVCGVFLHSNK